MSLTLFPERFTLAERCFGLKIVGTGVDPFVPPTIKFDPATHCHLIHSDFSYWAYLVGLVVVQNWVSGINEEETPPDSRQPIVLVTDRPGQFGDHYLDLAVSVDDVKRISVQRRVNYYNRKGRGPLASNKSEYWENFVDTEKGEVRLQSLFPAHTYFADDGDLRQLSGREFLGRGDESGPALILTRRSDHDRLEVLCRQVRPWLIIFDAQGVEPQRIEPGLPSVVFHESIFSPRLISIQPARGTIHCLPDQEFQAFCEDSEISLAEQIDSPELVKIWNSTDSAFQALIESYDAKRIRLLREVYRSSERLRTLLVNLPIGVTQYEQVLIISDPAGLRRSEWSVAQLLEVLSNRTPEVVAIGDWEEMVYRELVSGLEAIAKLNAETSPKSLSFALAIQGSLGSNKNVGILVKHQAYAHVVNWMCKLPPPLGLGLDTARVKAITHEEIATLDGSWNLLVSQFHDPYLLLSTLQHSGPRTIKFVLSASELRFIKVELLRCRDLLPEHIANTKLLLPLHQVLEKIGPIEKFVTDPGLAEQAKWFSRMSNAPPQAFFRGVVLTDDHGDDDGSDTQRAILVKLEGDSAVFLRADRKVTVIDGQQSFSEMPDRLRRGTKLVVINPQSRESLIGRVLARAGRTEDTGPEMQLIKRWQTELNQAISNSGITKDEILRKITAFGSGTSSAAAVNDWMKQKVLGPIDAEDIRRLGEVLRNVWLKQNWKQVGQALTFIRTGRRLIGRQLSRVIVRVATGHTTLDGDDSSFLSQNGLSAGELIDAVSLLRVELAIPERRDVSTERIGTVFYVDMEGG